MVGKLETRAPVSWIGAESALLLLRFWTNDYPAAARDREASLWVRELSRFPLWALERAFAWWTSAANDRRHMRPFEGDIAERAEVEMEPVRIAQKRLEMAERLEVGKNG